MKKIILSLLLLSGITAAYAQKESPALKDGSTFLVTAIMQGQEIPVVLTLQKKEGPVSFKWSVEGYGEGVFQLTEKGAESGTGIFQGQPSAGTTSLSDNETFGMISRSAYKNLVDTKSFTYNGMKFTAKTGTPAIKLNGKEADATHVATEDGKVQIWILNNAVYPLILQSNGMGTDTVISEIK